MCGIAGVVHLDGAPIPDGLVEQMCACIAHRGPNDRGIVHLPQVALGNQRLSIIDVAGGHQPIANEDRTVWTVLNGEIYNFVELRERLQKHGHQFATRSDTEVIVHAYEQWGDDFVNEIDGMFALALWDARARRLVLARDRFGKKPLVYTDQRGQLAFASELQALAPVPGVDRGIDLEALGAYFNYMAIPAPRTVFRGVRKLPPAHLLVYDSTGVKMRRYWTLRFLPKRAMAESDAVEQTRHLVRAAVRKRLVSEVPLGAFLSGGVDSSVVVGMMAELSNQQVKTFSIGFEQAAYDELPHARRVATALGSEHHEFVVRASAVEVLPDMVRHFGEPFADSSAVPSWYLARLTSQRVTVALNGDGGDEIFAGYGRHRANRLAEQWQKAPAALRALGALGGKRAARFTEASRLSRADRYRAWAGVFSADLLAQLSSSVPSDDRVVPPAMADARDLDAVDAFLSVDTNVYLPTDLLVKMDITSMAHSLEVRSPLLDTALAEFVAALPSTLKLKGRTAKFLLKQAAPPAVPRENLKRPKRGFAVPIGAWFRGELKPFLNDHLRASKAAAAGLVRQPAIDQLVDAHVSGQRDYAHHLWVLLMLELWCREARV